MYNLKSNTNNSSAQTLKDIRFKNIDFHSLSLYFTVGVKKTIGIFWAVNALLSCATQNGIYPVPLIYHQPHQH